jgi:hypothetical protein
MSYQGEAYLGIEGVFEDAQRRVFRVDRIIEVA